ncbi:MAG: hypothetical protein RLZZ158_171 [Cyanobacteriota bacterium]|jgi:hypothetical protein
MQPQTKAHLLLELLVEGGWTAQQLTATSNSDGELLQACLGEVIGLREAGDAELSLQLIDQALALGLTSPWFQDNRARALLALGQRQEALGLWVQLSREPDHLVAASAVAMLMENADSAAEQGPPLGEASLVTFGSLTTEAPPPAPPEAPADELRTDQQLQALKEVIRLREEGQLEASLELIDAALAAGETDPWWLDNKARVLVELNNHVEALLLWEQLSAAAHGDAWLGQVAQEMAALQGQTLLAPLLSLCEQNGWQPQYLGTDDQPLLRQLLQELSASRELGEAELSLALVSKARDLGFESPWINDNEARALVNLQREAEAVALWRNLQLSNDATLATMAAEMLVKYGPKVERRERLQQAEQLLEQGDAAAAEALLLTALLQDPDHHGYRQLLQRALAAQLGVDDGGQLGPEIRERELRLEGHARLLALVERRLGLIGVSD